METKKNPSQDLNRQRHLYFVIGLALTLSLIYIALEWKSDNNKEPYTTDTAILDEITEAVPLIVLKTPPPPPPPINPPILDIVDDGFEGEETEVTDSQPAVEYAVPVDSITYVAPEEDILIPISAVESIPIFPGCENKTDKLACFNTMMRKHVKKHFRYPESEQEMGIQGRVNIMFEIQKNGSIGNLRMRGPSKNLEKEAARIIEKLPQMTPGKQGGKAVRVPYSIPIIFKLQ